MDDALHSRFKALPWYEQVRVLAGLNNGGRTLRPLTEEAHKVMKAMELHNREET